MGQPHAQAPLGEQKFTYILSLPNAHHVAYALAKDPALYQKAVTANPIEFGQLIAAVAPPSSVASPASTGRVGSVPPPAPYQPVGSGSKTTAPTSAEATKGGYDFDKSGYRERRAAERGVTRRR
jgi:hypothetical protein